MNKRYNLKLDLQFRCNNSIMKFNQFDNNTSDFFMRITNGGKLVDIEKAIVVLAAIKPSGKVASQFVEVENGLVYADLKASMKDEIGIYTAQAMLILEDERIVTEAIAYEVEEDKIFSLLNDSVEATEEFTLLTDMLSRLSTIEISEEQRVINEAERILSEENRKIEEAKRVEAELIRQHEEADRAKYDATRESNENIRKQNEEARISSENVRLENEAKRVEEEANRVKAEQLRKDNYNFMTEDEERRRLEANAHKEAEILRVQAETNRVNEEAKRRTTEQARVSAENTRVGNENTRKANETTRQTNETQRVEAETQRQNRYNSFIADAEANANNFENYTNTAKVKEEERKSNELDRKSQEARRVSNEVERISNENTRKANEKAREKNETSRQYVFENKVDEVDKKIIEINATKDNFVSSVNTKVDSKISELDNTKSDMATSINNKVNEVENRFNALTSKQQQDAEVIDARDGETSLKARLDRDIEKAKQVYVNVEGSNISTDSSDGYLKNVEILGNTVQDSENLADIRSVGDTVEGQELYEIPVLSCGKNIFNLRNMTYTVPVRRCFVSAYEIPSHTKLTISLNLIKGSCFAIFLSNTISNANNHDTLYADVVANNKGVEYTSTTGKISFDSKNYKYLYITSWVRDADGIEVNNIQLEEGTQATPYEPYQEDKLTILSPTPLEKVGDVRDRIIEKDGVWGVEKNITDDVIGASSFGLNSGATGENTVLFNMYNTSRFFGGNNRKVSVMSDLFEGMSADAQWTSDIESIAINNNNTLLVRILKDKLTTLDTAGFSNWLDKNNISIKKFSNEPTFIPLPHSQQVKLRTFANKTNISFGCEIEGTIKAQVPKSLGATVNTHTEQINNLNKELDRVKKLEESTVSTVITESDFTTVEQTTNGYFEDVKLEGKTLVNLMGTFRKTGTISHKYVSLGKSEVEVVAGKTYTVCSLTNKRFDLKYSTPDEAIKTIGTLNQVVMFNFKAKYDSKLAMIALDSEGDYQSDIMLLEGDHTQNPPSGYIEGLKSVGQDVEEMSVESVSENLFDVNKHNTLRQVNDYIETTSYTNHFVEYSLLPNTDYTLSFDKYNNDPCWVATIVEGYDTVNNGNMNFRKTYRTDINGILRISIRANGSGDIGHKIKNVMLTQGTTPKPYTPHQSNKKRLLYYNEETQTWEKPILREGDSIEKHADGKYYYHQRSAEVVLNGSENWNNDTNSSTISPATYRQSIQFDTIDIPSASFNTKTSPNIISDLLPTVIFGDVYSHNHIGISISGTGSVGTHIIINNNFTDVTELKQWLQANNLTLVYQLAEEKVYECTNIDLITYANETNFIVESGVLSPKTTLKVHSNISNVVSLLQKKVSLLESNMTKYMITQNRLMLASRYNADTVSFKVDVASFSDTFEYDNDLYELILNNILVGKDNYNREYIENLIRFYWMDFIISDEMYSTLFEIIKEQHNPKIEEEEETPLI